MILRRAMKTIVALVLAGCAAGPGEQELANLCDFGQRPDSVLLGHVDQTGELYVGEIDPKAFADFTASVPSAVALPKADVYRTSYRMDCYNKAKDYWFPCRQKVEIDLRAVRGIGRGESLERAGTIAVRMCESKIRRLLPAEVSGSVSVDLECLSGPGIYCPVR